MLVDCYDPEDMFARVPEVVAQTDPVLKILDGLLDDDQSADTEQVLTEVGVKLVAIPAADKLS